MEEERETCRVRKVVFLFYLFDETLQILEHVEENAGMVKGCFLKRARHRKKGGGYVGLSDLVVGQTIAMYGRTFHFVDCDDATRKIFEENHQIVQPPALEYPGQQDVLSARLY